MRDINFKFLMTRKTTTGDKDFFLINPDNMSSRLKTESFENKKES